MPQIWGYLPLGFWLTKNAPELKGAARVVYQALGQFVNAGNPRPTKREILGATGLSENTVDAALKHLREHGFLLVRLSDRSANTYTLLRGPWNDPPPAAGVGGAPQPLPPLKTSEKTQGSLSSPPSRSGGSDPRAKAADPAPAPAREPAAVPPAAPVVAAAFPERPEPQKLGKGRTTGANVPRSVPLVVKVGEPPKTAEKTARPPALAPDVVETLGRVPGGRDALRALARARLTEPEQRRVVARVLEYQPDHAGKYIHGPIGDVRADRDVKAEAEAAEVHDYVPDGGPVPEHLKPHAEHLKPRPVPKPRDPRRDRLQGLRDRLALCAPGHPARPKYEQQIAELEAEIAKPPAPVRRGLHLVRDP